MADEIEPDGALRLVLATLAPVGLATPLGPGAASGALLPSIGVAAGVALLLLFGAAQLPWRPRLARASATLGLAVAWVGWALAHPERAGTGLVLLVAASSLVFAAWTRRGDPSWLAPFPPVAASAGGLAALILIGSTAGVRGPAEGLGLAGAAAVPAAVMASGRDLADRQLGGMGLLVSLLWTVLALGDLISRQSVATLAVLPSVMALRAMPLRALRPSWLELLDVTFASRGRLLAASFAALCAVGGAILSLPFAHAGGVGLAPIDAAFMAVSAVCVTGLVVLDPSTSFSLAGQVALLALIQAGGLGIMTFAAGAVVLAGRRLNLRQEAVAAQLLGGGARADLAGALRRVLLVTAATELIGAALLFPAFVSHGDGALAAAWRASFTSVSAFCNAGFALQPDSLIGYQRDPYVLLVVGGIGVVGSLGPLVTALLFDVLRGRPVPMFVRLSVVATAVLLVFPTAAVLALEAGNALRALPWHHKLANAWFYVASTRSAGFNSFDLAQVSPATLTLTLLLMFVGGCSGSTAGGIKVTTAAVLLLSSAAAVRGDPAPRFGSRQIGHAVVHGAGAIAMGVAATALMGFLLLQLTQRSAFEVLLFDAVSASATVGLSIGATGQADAVGKIVLIACMFAGRVGPLSLLMFFESRPPQGRMAYPIEEVPVG